MDSAAMLTETNPILSKCPITRLTVMRAHNNSRHQSAWKGLPWKFVVIITNVCKIQCAHNQQDDCAQLLRSDLTVHRVHQGAFACPTGADQLGDMTPSKLGSVEVTAVHHSSSLALSAPFSRPGTWALASLETVESLGAACATSPAASSFPAAAPLGGEGGGGGAACTSSLLLCSCMLVAPGSSGGSGGAPDAALGNSWGGNNGGRGGKRGPGSTPACQAAAADPQRLPEELVQLCMPAGTAVPGLCAVGKYCRLACLMHVLTLKT